MMGVEGAGDYFRCKVKWTMDIIQSDGKVYSGGTGSTYGNTYSNGNIIGIFLDLDNNKLYFSIRWHAYKIVVQEFQ